MIHWLTGNEERDVRYLLAELILSPEIQSDFDVILLDSPPRLTTAAVQALAASRHLLIPTILDRLSVEAVEKFVTQIDINRTIWPSLRLAGVVGSMTERNIGHYASDPYDASHFKGPEEGAILALNDMMQLLRERTEISLPAQAVLPYTTFIPSTTDIGKAAANGVAAVTGSQTTKAVFERLGIEVAKRIGLSIE
jgi:chromosome partitioning protein